MCVLFSRRQHCFVGVSDRRATVTDLLLDRNGQRALLDARRLFELHRIDALEQFGRAESETLV